MSSARKGLLGPIEPVLEVGDIQGMALPGFLKPHCTVVGLELPVTAPALTRFRQKLAGLAAQLSTARETLDDRREHRKRRSLAAWTNHSLVGLAFSYPALFLLTAEAKRINSPAFQLGLASRSRLLGDPADLSNEGHPNNWIFGSDPNRPTLLLVVAAESREIVDQRTEEMLRKFRSAGCSACYRENGDTRPDLPGHEHFGFSDGISQPGIRGRASRTRDDFITPRYIARGRTPETWLYGYPGQDLVWPGEFILGYPVSCPNPLQPGPTLPCNPEWTRNGSFLVFRRLRQDVALFWQKMDKYAESLLRQPGFSGLDRVALASMLVGRWPSGAPRSRVPDGDNSKLGTDPFANNHFGFDSDSEPLPLAGREPDHFPQAKADPLGFACPGASHIRKLNTRDSASDMGGRETTYRARILRTGITFGPPLMPEFVACPEQDAAHGNRGLLFLCLQASIEGQFEFLQSRWLNNHDRPRLPGGHDLLVGQNPSPGKNRIRRATIFGRDLEKIDLRVSTEWIIPTGGGYFFVPSIRAIKQVLASRAGG